MEIKHLLKEVGEARKEKNYVSKLEKALASQEAFRSELLEAIQSKLTPVKLTPPKLGKAKHPSKREIVVMLNDTHYGLIVDPEEVNNLNSYGWKEASRRTAAVIEQALAYKSHVKDIRKVHLVLNGDIIAGVIHATNTKGIDLLVHQMNGALHILSHAITALSKRFSEIEVHCAVGNHARMPHKDLGRVMQEKFDSYETLIYTGLSAIFKNNKNVTFNIPKTPYTFINLPAGRALVTHGDTIFEKALGNTGKVINVKNLGEAIQNFNFGETKKKKAPVKLALFGHVHSMCNFVYKGVAVYVAPSLCGIDPYANSLNITDNFAGQVVFESTEDFIFGDSRLVSVIEADERKELDKLIPVFDRNLKA